jgi:hypothetical protein
VDLETSCLPFGVEVDVMEGALLDDKEETAERLRGFLRGGGSYCKPRRDLCGGEKGTVGNEPGGGWNQWRMSCDEITKYYKEVGLCDQKLANGWGRLVTCLNRQTTHPYTKVIIKEGT